MRALLSAAVFLGGCTVPLTRDVRLNLSFEGRVSHRSNLPAPHTYTGLRLSVTRQP